MDTNQSIVVTVEEHFETALLLTIAQCFGSENRYRNYTAISALVYLVKSKYKDSGIIISSAQAFRILCQRGFDFRDFLD